MERRVLRCRCNECGRMYNVTNLITEVYFNKCPNCRKEYGSPLKDQLEAIRQDQIRHNRDLRKR